MTQDRATAAPAHPDELAGVSFRPFFIMGDHRSGTTLLYSLLEASGCFNVVRAYHIIRRQELLADHQDGREDEARRQIATQLEQAGMTDRRLDRVAVSPDLPEEYGFVLEQGLRPRLNPANLERFRRFCRLVQAISEPDRPLLLKNPWDFANFLYVRSAFPETRFIFLHRHPLRVIDSQIRAARALYQEKSIYHALLDPAYDRLWHRPLQLGVTRLLFSPYFGMGFRVAMRHVNRATAYFLENVAALPKADFVEIRFEDVLGDPAAAVGHILSFLGLRPAAAADYAAMIQPRDTPLLAEVARQQEQVLSRLGAYLDHCGYGRALEALP